MVAKRSGKNTKQDGLDLIFEFCNAVELGEVTGALQREVAKRLRMTLGPDGITADKALRIRRISGAKSKKTAHTLLAAAVLERKNAGMKVEAAIQEVSDQNKKCLSTVRHAYEDYRKRASMFLYVRKLYPPDN